MTVTYYPEINLLGNEVIPPVSLTEAGESQMYDIWFNLISLGEESVTVDFDAVIKEMLIYDAHFRGIAENYAL